MRIISPFKDYYDSAVGYGIDTSICYVRTQSEIHLGVKYWKSEPQFDVPYPSDFRDSDKNDWKIERYLIGFCGNLLPCVRVIGLHTGDNLFFYDFKEYKNWRLGHQEERRLRRYKPEKSNTQEFFERYAGKKTDEPFLQHKTPCFVVGGGRNINLIVNPVLADYGFYKVKDAFTAFQEISMYLSNQLVERKEVEDIADKYRIAGHGFDKTSFRHPIKLKDL